MLTAGDCNCDAQFVVIDLVLQVVDVLEVNNFADSRVAKMDQNSILRLLDCFNRAGIHFA